MVGIDGLRPIVEMVGIDGLRPVVEAVDREMSRVRARAGGQGDLDAGLLSSWEGLIAFLALGPPPDLRACPFCAAVGRRAATRCGACWRRLAPTAPPKETRCE